MSSVIDDNPALVRSPQRPHTTAREPGLGSVPRSAATRPVVVVANRLPGDRDATGRWARSPGGLVTAVLPAITSLDATWIGARTGERREATCSSEDGVRIVELGTSADEHDLYCDGFSNSTLWPLYHDAIVPPRYDQSWWTAYGAVSKRFAHAAARFAPPGASVWIHDYHLQLVPAMLRSLRSDVRIGYFHHIPFPNTDLFRQLPWRSEIIEGLLGADLIGFQRQGDVANFCDAAASLCDVRVDESRCGPVLAGGRRVDVDAFPVPVDAAAFARRGNARSTIDRACEIRVACGSPRHLLLGVDRLDYTKGIDQRLAVVRTLFSEGVLQSGRDAYLQVAVPSRADANGYAELRARVERLVGDINGEFADVGAPVVHYLHRSLEVDELTAMYRAADVMLVTPFRDGMNLVAKEYVASRTDGAGSLVLSEFTGAADELSDAWHVNPHDTRSMQEAVRSALGSPDHGRAAMRSMRAAVANQSPSRWATSFLSRLEVGP